MVVARVAAVGVLVVVVGLVVRPEALTGGAFVSDRRSPLHIDDFELAQQALRVGGVVAVVAARHAAALLYLSRRAGGVWGLAALGGVAVLPAVARGTGAGMARLVWVSAVAAVTTFAADRVVQEPDAPVGRPGWWSAGADRVGGFDRPALAALSMAQAAGVVWAFALLTAVNDWFRASIDASRSRLLPRPRGAWRGRGVWWRSARSGPSPPRPWCAVVVAATVVFADGTLATNGHFFCRRGGALGGPWPLLVVAGAGVIGGWRAGVRQGAVVYAARLAGVVVADAAVFEAQALGLAGAAAGRGGVRRRRGCRRGPVRAAEATIASARRATR